MATADNIPAGFGPLPRTSPAIELIGPIHAKGLGSDMVLGLRAEPKQCNGRHKVHGGILADVALGYATSFSTHPPTGMVTANLSLDYTGSAQVGDWLETSVDVHKIGSRLAFASAHIHRNGERIVRASAVFVVATAPDAEPNT
ncbi:MAG: PaaI family thioesterase [Pseudomonadota bacterium]|nr:PaaI family thioesterase [Pseudomonadota bacterium]